VAERVAAAVGWICRARKNGRAAGIVNLLLQARLRASLHWRIEELLHAKQWHLERFQGALPGRPLQSPRNEIKQRLVVDIHGAGGADVIKLALIAQSKGREVFNGFPGPYQGQNITAEIVHT